MRICERTGRVIRSNREWRELAEAAQAEVERLRKTLEYAANYADSICATHLVEYLEAALRGEGEK